MEKKVVAVEILPPEETAGLASREAKMRTALEMSVRGCSYQQIADGIGCGIAGAYQLVRQALQREKQDIKMTNREVKQLEAHRLDRMHAALADQIDAGDVKAIDTAIKVQDRRSRLLGLDAPTKTVELGLHADITKFGGTAPEKPEDARRLLSNFLGTDL